MACRSSKWLVYGLQIWWTISIRLAGLRDRHCTVIFLALVGSCQLACKPCRWFSYGLQAWWMVIKSDGRLYGVVDRRRPVDGAQAL